MEADLPQNAVEQKLDEFNESVDKLKCIVEDLTYKRVSDYLEASDDINKARSYHAIAFLINALVFVYMKSKGVSVENHALLSELERLKHYHLKLYDTDFKSAKINTSVLKRTIKHSISPPLKKHKKLQPGKELDNPSAKTTADRFLKGITEELKKKD